MAQIESIDYANKRIHLHADTVVNGFDCIAAHFEISQRILANQNGEQNHPHPLSADGNVPKGGGKFTPRYGLLESGWRLVPYGGVSHVLSVNTEVISKDGLSGRDTFDRLPLNVQVDIDEAYDKVEIREVYIGSGVTEQDKADIAQKVWQEPVTNHPDKTTMGGWLSRKVATLKTLIQAK